MHLLVKLMPFWMSLHEFTSYNYEDANAFNKSESLNYNNVDMNAHWVLHVWNIPDILYYTRRSGIESTSHWAEICCFVKKYPDLFGGLDTSEHTGEMWSYKSSRCQNMVCVTCDMGLHFYTTSVLYAGGMRREVALCPSSQ